MAPPGACDLPSDAGLLSTAEVALRLGGSASKVHTLIRTERLATVVHTGKYRVPEKAVDGYLAAQTAGPVPATSAIDALARITGQPDEALAPIVTVEETAAYLRMSTEAVRAAIARGDIPSIPWGKRRRAPALQPVSLLIGAA